MNKEEYWFKHASNAKDDPKCMLLIEELGLEGYGIFWVLIETLRDQPGYKANIRILPVLARRYNTTLEKIKMVIQRFDLFYVDNEQLFFSPSLIRRMEPLDKMREAGRLGGKKSGKVRQLKAKTKGASKGASSPLEPTEQNRTEQNREEKNIKEKNITNISPLIEGLSSVKKMQEPLTVEQGEELVKEYGFELVSDTLLAMENYKPLLKKNKSTHLTCRNWMRRYNNSRKQKNNGFSYDDSYRIYGRHDEVFK